MNFKMIFALPFLAIALMGQSCPNTDEKVRQVLASWCPAIDTAYAHYVPLKRFVSERYQEPAETAFAEFQMLCDGRATATTQTVLTKAVFAGDAIYAAIRNARSNGATSVGYQGNIKALEGMLGKLRSDIK